MRRFAVVGSPISHSLSPLLHRTAYEHLAVSGARYDRFEVGPGGLADFLQDGPGTRLDGLSVTMPVKPEAFALASEADAVSQLLGVSNTLLRRADGTWRAENHDVHGIAATLRAHGAGAGRAGSRGAGSHEGARPVGAILGSGATAACAVAALERIGVREVLLSARSARRLDPLEELAIRLGLVVHRIPWERSHEVLAADVLVSALAAPGGRAVAEAWASASLPRLPAVLLDVLYDPWPAPIAALIAARGGAVASGLEMLAHQADMQVRSMLGTESAPVGAMLEAARRALS